jgi:hypothetical protein
MARVRTGTAGASKSSALEELFCTQYRFTGGCIDGSSERPLNEPEWEWESLPPNLLQGTQVAKGLGEKDSRLSVPC